MSYQIPELLDFSSPVTGLVPAGNLPACLYEAMNHIPENRRQYMSVLADFARSTYYIGLDLQNHQGSHEFHHSTVGSLLEQSLGKYDMTVLPNDTFARLAPMDTKNLSESELRVWMGQVLSMKNFMWHKLDKEKLHSLAFLFYKAAASRATSPSLDFPDDFDWAGRLSQLYRAMSVITRCGWRGWDVKGFRGPIASHANAALGHSYPFTVGM